MRSLAAVWLVVLGCVACAKKDPPHRTEPWLAKPSASSAALASAPRTFHFLGESSLRFSVQGRKGKLSGHLPLSQGKLRLDPRDLSTATASIDADLSKLEIDTPPDAPESAPLGASSPSAIALQWLELGPGVAPERRAQFSQARFELASVEGLASPLLDLGATRQPAAHVRATAVGTLLIHGFRAPIRADVLLQPLKTAPGAASRLSIRSAGALVLALAPHDITARGPSGIADALAMARAGDWVGKTARIEFELLAEPDLLSPNSDSH
jgi:hypothetical protein